LGPVQGFPFWRNGQSTLHGLLQSFHFDIRTRRTRFERFSKSTNSFTTRNETDLSPISIDLIPLSRKTDSPSAVIEVGMATLLNE
jgi:hypothetical protein